jgi:hypothetical protein
VLDQLNVAVVSSAAKRDGGITLAKYPNFRAYPDIAPGGAIAGLSIEPQIDANHRLNMF